MQDRYLTQLLDVNSSLNTFHLLRFRLPCFSRLTVLFILFLCWILTILHAGFVRCVSVLTIYYCVSVRMNQWYTVTIRSLSCIAFQS